MAMEEEEEELKALHFTLHLDKPLPCLVEIAAWNPEKDLLAMVSTDHQLTVHRFNWQRLWAITPDKKVTSICWRPDGKALAAGLEDGEISLHDVENGDVMRKIETHKASVQCLYWVEEKRQATQDSVFSHEDRTPRFFPPPPKAPAMPGTGSAFDMVGVLGSGDDQETTHQNAASKTLQQHLNILCSGDSDGIVCLNAFGVFPIGQLDVQNLPCGGFHQPPLSATKVTLSGDLCNMVLLCHERPFGKRASESIGLVAISVDTNLLSKRHKEIRQVALQASSVEELLDVVQTTLTVMKKHWFDAISVFTEKFTAFHTLLREHGSQSTPRDELLSLLACGSASASLHQFLAVTLGEGGLKRLAKNIDAAGRELHNLIAEHLQPAAEIIAFRIGELLALSHWRSHLQSIGLDESLVDSAMENAGMLLVQVERLLHIVSDTTGQFRLFFVWLTKSLRQLNGESVLLQAEQGLAINSAAIAAFLKAQFECDPIGPNLSSEGAKSNTGFEEDQTRAEDQKRAEKLLLLGGFKDTKFLQRTLFQQFEQLCASCRAAFSMPVTVISPRLFLRSQLPLCHFPSSISTSPPLSLTYYEIKKGSLSVEQATGFVDCTCFHVCVEGSSYIGVIRQMVSQNNAAEVAALHLEGHLACVDLALYKERQLVLLVTEKASHGGNDQAWIMVLQLEDLPFISLNGLPGGGNGLLRFCTSNEAVVVIGLKDGKARCIPQLDVIPPLAVSASRGLACVFAAQRRALLYDLEEDEEEKDNETT